jgi:hypothetical protein
LGKETQRENLRKMGSSMIINAVKAIMGAWDYDMSPRPLHKEEITPEQAAKLAVREVLDQLLLDEWFQVLGPQWETCFHIMNPNEKQAYTTALIAEIGAAKKALGIEPELLDPSNIEAPF